MHDVFLGVPDITSRAMFGGWGIYQSGVIFAMIAEDELYFKVDTNNRADFEARGSHPFVYTMPKPNGKTMAMSYWKLPEEIMENRDELKKWIAKSVQANINKQKRSKK